MNEHTISQSLIEEFAQSLYQAEKSRATIFKYMRDVRTLAAFAGQEPASKYLMIRYKSWLQENYAPASVNSMLVAANCFFKFAGWYECIVKTVRIQHQSFRSQDRELSRAEYLRLLNAANKRKNFRLLNILQTLCATGIRISELQFITVESVQQGQALVSLKGKTRQILLPSSLCRELKNYCRKQKIRSGKIFVTKSGNCVDRSNILHEMKKLCQEANVEPSKVFPHNLRHLFASLYYQATKDISHLADILGHSTIDTTRIYTRSSSAVQTHRIDKLGLTIKSTA